MEGSARSLVPEGRLSLVAQSVGLQPLRRLVRLRSFSARQRLPAWRIDYQRDRRDLQAALVDGSVRRKDRDEDSCYS
jgi:hypothetical protein